MSKYRYIARGYITNAANSIYNEIYDIEIPTPYLANSKKEAEKQGKMLSYRFSCNPKTGEYVLKIFKESIYETKPICIYTKELFKELGGRILKNEEPVGVAFKELYTATVKEYLKPFIREEHAEWPAINSDNQDMRTRILSLLEENKEI